MWIDSSRDGAQPGSSREEGGGGRRADGCTTPPPSAPVRAGSPAHQSGLSSYPSASIFSSGPQQMSGWESSSTRIRVVPERLAPPIRIGDSVVQSTSPLSPREGYHEPSGPPYGSWVQYGLDIDAVAVRVPRARSAPVTDGLLPP